jgi:predicted CXXCH cytochrome family protein
MWSRVALVASIFVPAMVLLTGTDSRPVDARDASMDSQALTGTETAPAEPGLQEPPSGDEYCLSCHTDKSLSTSFTDGRPLSLYVDARVLRDSAHELLNCVTCHNEYEVLPPELRPPIEGEAYRAEATAMCARCHQVAAEDYAGSAHSEPPLETGEGATCSGCHSPEGSGHSVGSSSGPESDFGPARVAETCGSCHEKALSSYEATSHSKVANLGEAKTTATCTTCHAGHSTEPAKDLVSAPGIAALTAVCADCHSGAGESFARTWSGHSEGAPGSSLANIAGRGGLLLAVAVVAFGFVHVSLEVLRRLRGREGEER